MEPKRATSLMGAVAAGMAGAVTMYLLDPQQGRRRRALVRDKAVRAGHEASDATGVVARDMAHRAWGFLAELRGRLLPGGTPTPRRTEERARAILGRVVSHPGAITVNAQNGRLVVSGYILEREVDPLLNALRSVPGIQEVENRLEVGHQPEHMPSLQGGRRRPGLVPDIFQRRMAPATRLLLGAGSTALTLYGLGRRDLPGGVLATLGLVTGVRAATNLDYRNLVGLGGREAVRIQNAIEIDAPVEDVFDFLRHFENYPRFMHHIRQVRQGENGVWHWEADGPLGIGVSWDAVVTRLEPNRRISWKSLPGSEVGNTGTLWFEPTADGKTRVHVLMGYNPPAGAVGHAVAVLLGADPRRQMDEDLVRLQSLIERGKTSAKGQQVTREEIAR